MTLQGVYLGIWLEFDCKLNAHLIASIFELQIASMFGTGVNGQTCGAWLYLVSASHGRPAEDLYVLRQDLAVLRSAAGQAMLDGMARAPGGVRQEDLGTGLGFDLGAQVVVPEWKDWSDHGLPFPLIAGEISSPPSEDDTLFKGGCGEGQPWATLGSSLGFPETRPADH